MPWAGDDGESSPRLTRSRRLDCRIQGKKIGLRRNSADNVNYVSDALCGFGELCHTAVHLLRLRRRLASHLRRFSHARTDLLNGRGHFVGGNGDRLDVRGRGIGVFRSASHYFSGP